VKCSLLLHTHRLEFGPEFVSGDGIMEVARAAERAGFDSVSVTDHPVPSLQWMEIGGHHALDPFVALSFAAAATSRLRLMTHIYVLPYRNPFLSAKAVASLDVLSDGRVIFGVASGYLEAEFKALGVRFEERDELADEALRAMKAAWTQKEFDLQGKYFSARGHTQLPQPIQKPHPPIWVGGNSKSAIRRAVALCDGWIPVYTPAKYAGVRRTPALETVEDLRKRLDYAREAGEKFGREKPLEVAMAPKGARKFGTDAFRRDALLEEVAALRAAGVTYLNIGLSGRTRAEQIGRIEAFGAEVLPEIDRI
jgi:probable F420-dependent oxidoreductase